MTDDGRDEVLLGMELAAARVADETRGATASGPSPLRGISYSGSATVLWRWVDAPQDVVLEAFVHAYAGLGDGALVRSSLAMDDFYTLMTFARRCVLAALRNADTNAAEAAFDALSAIELERVDWRDVVVAASLASYAARRVGLPQAKVLAGAVRRAEPAVAELLERAVRSDAGSAGYHEVRTPSGPVLVDGGGPRAGVRDLMKRALGVADVLEADGRYGVTSVSVERDVPAVWLADSPEATEARRRLRGRVSVHAEPVESSAHFLLVFLAEAEDDRYAEAIASAARERVLDGALELGIAVGRRCAVVVARAAVQGVPMIEDAESLARLHEPIRALLG